MFTSCKKVDEKPNSALPENLKNGLLVLNEGLFQLNNASLSWIDLEKNTVNNDFFTDKTDRYLGDTGNDIKQYGAKIYIVVNVSSTVEVLNAQNGKSIKQIQMVHGSTPKQPRHIAFYGKHAFVSCFDGFVDVIDTTSLEIIKRIGVGLNPDQLEVSGNRLFVSNSGGLNGPQMDSTLSVINLSDFSEQAKIVVGKNPGKLISDDEGNIFVIVRGNYINIPSRLKKINAQSLTVSNHFEFEISGMEKMNHYLIISYNESLTQKQKIGLFNTENLQFEMMNFIDISQVQTLYNVVYKSEKKQIYVFDAKGYTHTGTVLIYNQYGNLMKSFEVGLNPKSLLVF
jgi:DNA-binding beta-propeller fold protein YncE